MKRRSRGSWDPRWVAVTCAGVVGAYLGIDAMRAPSASAAEPQAAAPQAAAPGDTPTIAPTEGDDLGLPLAPGEVRVEPVAAMEASLAERLTRPAADLSLMELLDLRKLVVEHRGTPEAAQAQAALAGERRRCAARSREVQADATEALRALTRVYLCTVSGEERRRIRGTLQAFAEAVYTPGRGAPPAIEEYEVRSGDALSRIARREGTDYRLIKYFSGLQRDTLRVGQRLRIPRGAVWVAIFKEDFELVAVYQGCFLMAFDIATGKNDCTPETTFTIAEKLVEPDWYSPNGQVFPYGTEENILGTRWMAFTDTEQHQGFGIHGTKFPESIGSEASMGCIRMRNHEVEVLFEVLPSGSTVRIQR